MTNRFRATASGAAWMLAIQMTISVGQLAYSAVTARYFAPSQFGSFAAALSLQGLLTVLTTTGLPAFLLQAGSVPAGLVKKIRILAVLGGLLASISYILIVPFWLDLLDAHDADAVVGVLTIAQFVAPIAAVESALLRREGRSRADAMTLLVSFIFAYTVGTVSIIVTGNVWTLALAVLINAVLLAIFARLTQRPSHDLIGNVSRTSILRFSGQISRQNVLFLVFQQLPGWVLSASSGAQGYGHFSRASTLVGMPSTAISTAINRALQPQWRHVNDPARMDLAVRDALTLTGWISFSLFGILGALGAELSRLWLGPGWDTAGKLVLPLSIAFAFSIPFTVLANNLEMRGLLVEVRKSQYIIFIATTIPLIFLLITSEVFFAALAVAFGQIAGLIALLKFAPWYNDRSYVQTLGALSRQFLWGISCFFVAEIGSKISVHLDLNPSINSDIFAVLLGGLMALLFLIITLRANEVRIVLSARGIRFPGPFA